jgi:hypothetical protein
VRSRSNSGPVERFALLAELLDEVRAQVVRDGVVVEQRVVDVEEVDRLAHGARRV